MPSLVNRCRLQRSALCTPGTSGRCSLPAALPSPHASSPRGLPLRHRRTAQVWQAIAESGGEVYTGRFGQWRLEQSDMNEVLGYRAGLSVAAAALVFETVISFLPEEAKASVRGLENGLALVGAGGLGVSLYLIHIYVAPLKRFIQALWALGLAGSLYLMATQAAPLPEHVAAHREAVWLVGPFFAAVTGVAFKEGMCYGKAEAGALFFVTPLLLLGHLTGIVPEAGERALLVAFVGLALVFAARKYTQPIKDDVGDKSVFTFLALPRDEQERLWQLTESKDHERDSDI